MKPVLLQPGRYMAAFPFQRQDDFSDWTKRNLRVVSVWAFETCFAETGPKARSCGARFEVFSPVEWGALPAPEVLA